MHISEDSAHDVQHMCYLVGYRKLAEHITLLKRVNSFLPAFQTIITIFLKYLCWHIFTLMTYRSIFIPIRNHNILSTN